MNTYAKIAIAIFIATVLLFIASEIRIEASSTKEYTIEAGKQNFRPGESILPYFSVNGFEIWAVFDSSAWYSLEEWEGDSDWYDWNKLKGFSNMLSPKNKQTAMYAWRPDTRAYTIQVAAYTNDRRGGWTVGPPALIPCGQTFHGKVNWLSRKAIYEYGEVAAYSKKEIIEHEVKRPFIAIETGTWMGGANNAHGPYGGKATKKMKILVEMTMK